MKSSLYTAQHARFSISCTECCKPRVVYSQYALTERQKVTILLSITESDYTCGAGILPINHAYTQKVVVRKELTCADEVEIAYYSANLGRKDICSYCAIPEAIVDADLKKKYKTVLPICVECHTTKEPTTRMPYPSTNNTTRRAKSAIR